MTDPTEAIRRTLISTGQPERALQTATQRWDREALEAEFEVLGFLAPFIIVRRRSDGAKGSMEFTHEPRFYFNFVEDTK